MRLAGTAISIWLIILSLTTGQSRFPGMLDAHPAIEYRSAPVSDPVTLMRQQLEGEPALPFNGPQGYLRAVLARLEVPVESQLLVFSKTGIQHPFTTPENPRALYFNDRVVVGYIPGAPLI